MEQLASQMTLLYHLEELRDRLVKAAIVVFVCTLLSAAFTTQNLELLITPYGQKLQVLGPPEGIRPTDLAEQAALTKSGLTRAIDRLESQRLIERRACPTDARGQLIVLSAEGKRNLRRSAPEHFRSIARNFADHLTDREVEVLTTALERIAGANDRR